MNKKDNGFTLIEILISILIISISFILIQRTFFTLQKNIFEAEEKIKKSETFFKFFTSLNSEINGICDWENIQLNSGEIIFTTFLPDSLYPVEITYKVKDEIGYKLLLRKQKNIFTGYEFTLPVLIAGNIEFLFFTDGEWKYEITDNKKPEGIGIGIYTNEEKIFYPFYLIYERENE